MILNLFKGFLRFHSPLPAPCIPALRVWLGLGGGCFVSESPFRMSNAGKWFKWNKATWGPVAVRTLEICGIQNFENKGRYLGCKACFEIGHCAYMSCRLPLSPTFFLLLHQEKCFYMVSVWITGFHVGAFCRGHKYPQITDLSKTVVKSCFFSSHTRQQPWLGSHWSLGWAHILTNKCTLGKGSILNSCKSSEAVTHTGLPFPSVGSWLH